MDNKKDNKEVFIYKKSEKICSALHLVTNFFDKNEPLKMSLREASLELVSLSVSFNRQADLSFLIDSFHSRVMKIKAFLETAVFSGLVSKMNYAVLIEELDKVLVVLESKKKESFGLPSSFLEVEIEERAENKHESAYFKTQSVKNIVKDGDSNNPKVLENNSSRKDIIMNLLKEGQELTIKDFSDSIKDCSEKTIQRELLRLVALGVIEKKGERRWSRYKLTLSH